jgi:hypothetical protein
LRAISILGMKQARTWNCGSLNEFRKFFGLKKYDTFEEINPDPYVAEQLKHLYGKQSSVQNRETCSDRVQNILISSSCTLALQPRPPKNP